MKNTWFTSNWGNQHQHGRVVLIVSESQSCLFAKNLFRDFPSENLPDESIIKTNTLILVFPGAGFSQFPEQIHWNRKTLHNFTLTWEFLSTLSIPPLSFHTQKSHNTIIGELDLDHLQKPEYVKKYPRVLTWVISMIFPEPNSCIENMLIHACTVLLPKPGLLPLSHTEIISPVLDQHQP